ncbi:hypothetical protein MG296_06860 [Flavobacteriaceae bacterium TK19130]|nr:hypothetical protein [Thermobacterium salinum]
MKIDLYTKTLLTIIAICLTFNVLKDFDVIPSAYANDTLPETSTEYTLVPVTETNTMDVRIVDIYTSDELNVNLKGISTYDEMKVNVNSIDTSDELDVNIDEVGGQSIFYGSGVPISTD